MTIPTYNNEELPADTITNIPYMSDFTRMGIRPIFIHVHYLKIILC